MFFRTLLLVLTVPKRRFNLAGGIAKFDTLLSFAQTWQILVFCSFKQRIITHRTSLVRVFVCWLTLTFFGQCACAWSAWWPNTRINRDRLAILPGRVFLVVFVNLWRLFLRHHDFGPRIIGIRVTACRLCFICTWSVFSMLRLTPRMGFRRGWGLSGRGLVLFSGAVKIWWALVAVSALRPWSSTLA